MSAHVEEDHEAVRAEAFAGGNSTLRRHVENLDLRLLTTGGGNG